MEVLLSKAFDFTIRITELINYLDEENKHFPLKTRLLECAEGLCVSLRASNLLARSAPAQCTQALRQALEAECLLELMVKTGYLSETQSKPVLTDCRHLISETDKQLKKIYAPEKTEDCKK
jgi:hypothetical protein